MRRYWAVCNVEKVTDIMGWMAHATAMDKELVPVLDRGKDEAADDGSPYQTKKELYSRYCLSVTRSKSDHKCSISEISFDARICFDGYDIQYSRCIALV